MGKTWVTGETSHYEAWTLDAHYSRTKIDDSVILFTANSPILINPLLYY